MAENLDPEDVLDIMDGAFDILIEPITRYEGTLARLMGDAVLAFFGAPIAHEDDAQRACLAALEILKGAQGYAAQLEEERGIHGFNVRVGIHTGLVVVGEVGSDLRVEYTAVGDAINLAARMEQAAQPGTVLITGDTHKLVAPLFETEALGPVQVKGKAEPVPIYRVLAAKEVSAKPRGIVGLASPLVGRHTEFAALREAVERLQTGVGGIITIVGEAGIGKSRLVAELRKQVEAHGAVGAHGRAPLQWVEGRCLSYGASIAYLLWLDVLRGLLDVSIDDSPDTVRDALREQVQASCPDRSDQVFHFLARLLSLPLDDEADTRLDNLEGQALKDGTFGAVETMLECAATARPLALVCEDLHWADPSSMDLLEHLLALTRRAPLLFLCVFRPVREHRSWRLRETAAQEHTPHHTDLCLDPLSAPDSRTLVANLLEMEHLPQRLKDQILSHAEGNPFYLEEVIRSLIDDGAIVQDETSGRWQATRDVADIAIPDTLQGVLMARIDRLQEETKRVLQMAAVIGRIFLYRVLADIAAAEAAAWRELRLDQRLETLQREEMIRQRTRIPELEYIFKHHLTQEAAYNGLLRRQRRVTHRLVAEALERLFPERVEEQLGLLAYHWERAGDAEKAVAYLLRAGDQARTAYAHEEAVDYYQRALGFLKDTEQHNRAARTLMKLGLTYHNAFQFRRAREAYEEGFALWQRVEGVRPSTLPPAPHALRLVWYRQRTLDPAMAGSLAEAPTVGSLFSGLVELTPELDVVPDVARSWKVLEGGHKYLFHLRDDVRWSDGTPVSARDFEYAWKRILDPVTGWPGENLLYDLKGGRAFHRGEAGWEEVGVQARDQVTLVVELEEPAGHFLQLLAYVGTFPVPRHVVETHGEAWAEPENIVTNGPFRLEAWQRHTSIVLIRNAEYHGRFTGNLQRVELSLLPPEEWAPALERYEAGDLDIYHALELPLLEMDRARQRHAGEYVSAPWLLTLFTAFDSSRAPFDDSRVRRAFVLAADREKLVDKVMRGQYFPATGGFVPRGMPGYAAETALPYDPEGARRLLAEAGYPGGHGFPHTVFLAPPGPAYREVNAWLLAQWQEELGVGIQEEAITEWPAFFERLSRDPPRLYTWGWMADYADPDNFLREGIPREQTGWRNEVYDALVEKARRVTDQEERLKLYRQADRILVVEAAIMPVAYARWHLLVKSWVSRYPTSAMSSCFWKDVIIEPH
jgi:ABC-type oligopeptide transport system substrate-binding subunit/class 3 adenylate cyclase